MWFIFFFFITYNTNLYLWYMYVNTATENNWKGYKQIYTIEVILKDEILWGTLY